jgi:hypothetical protein
MIFMTSVKFKDNQLNGHTFLFAINVHEQRYQQFCHPKKHFSQRGDNSKSNWTCFSTSEDSLEISSQ